MSYVPPSPIKNARIRRTYYLHEMENLLSEIKRCTICLPYLKDGVNPVMSAGKTSKILIIGQAPGAIVHQSGIPWEDKSGDRLREWMNISKEVFYNSGNVAIIPMGFCYPGKGTSGDLPPRPECAPQWHDKLFHHMNEIQLTLLIGNYAQKYYLGKNIKRTLTETVKCYEEYMPDYLPLPHPSPRNNIWLRKNPWFEKEVIPYLRQKVGQAGLQ